MGADMRDSLIGLAILSGAAFPGALLADDLSPGLWEITMETRIDASPEFAPQPVRLTQCLKDADARDPGRLLGGLSNPGASDCAFSDERYTGNRFQFAMRCGGSLGLQTQGDVSFTPTTMDGSITSTATVNGQAIRFRNTVSARRLGDC
jgi:hypothetical protein